MTRPVWWGRRDYVLQYFYSVFEYILIWNFRGGQDCLNICSNKFFLPQWSVSLMFRMFVQAAVCFPWHCEHFLRFLYALKALNIWRSFKSFLRSDLFLPHAASFPSALPPSSLHPPRYTASLSPSCTLHSFCTLLLPDSLGVQSEHTI